MKRLLFALLLLPFIASAQPGYTPVSFKYRWTGGYFTSGLHVPAANGVPSDVSGVWIGDGAIAVDTANGYFYWRVGGVWIKGAKFSDVPTLSGTTNRVALWNGSSSLTALSAGTSGQVLTSAGSGSDPTWETPTATDVFKNTTSGVLLGNSTIAAFSCGVGVDEFLLQDADEAAGTTITNDAVPGHTIAQQRAVWDADANKATYDWIMVEV